MKTVNELLKESIGGFTYEADEVTTTVEHSMFRCFRVRLDVGKYRGLPSEWLFCVLDTSQASGVDERTLVSQARIAIKEFPSLRIVLVSEMDSVRLGAEFEQSGRPIFCIDSADIPSKQNPALDLRLAPFVLAVRRRVSRTSSLLLEVSPYQRMKPVSGWRFFGREKELGQVVRSDENLIIIGPRRVGKTSLMLEASKALKERGEQEFYINIQDANDERDVLQNILRIVSPRDAARIGRRAHLLGETVLDNVFRHLTARHGRTTILLDELGNIFKHLPKGGWQHLLSTLRKYSQHGNLRFVASCFQELHLRQQDEFGGPLINFGQTMRLGLFSESEIFQFIHQPLDFWCSITARQEKSLSDLVTKVVGGHPLLLQNFGYSLLQGIIQTDSDVATIGRRLLQSGQDLVECFYEAIEEIFYTIKQPTPMYLFLKRCVEQDDANEELRLATIDEEWIEQSLTDAGFISTFTGRRNLLQALEMYGLTSPLSGKHGVQVISSPVVYLVVKHTENSVPRVLQSLRRDIGTEMTPWGLREK